MVCGGPPRLLKANIKRKERSKKFNTFLDLYKVATIILSSINCSSSLYWTCQIQTFVSVAVLDGLRGDHILCQKKLWKRSWASGILTALTKISSILYDYKERGNEWRANKNLCENNWVKLPPIHLPHILSNFLMEVRHVACKKSKGLNKATSPIYFPHSFPPHPTVV